MKASFTQALSMYSGITQGLYPVSSITHTPGLIHYSVDLCDDLSRDLKVGASINVDGVCQSVCGIDANRVMFDAMAETLRVTTLSELKISQRVSIERSLKVGDEHGGHDIYGHVSGVATLIHRTATKDNLELEFQCPPSWMCYLIPKGFIALNGSSLTLCECHKDGRFTVHLIPQTLGLTNFGALAINDQVNVELDAKAQLIVNTVRDTLSEMKVLN